MEITFLGTGAGMPSKKRNVTAIIVNVLAKMNHLWLFDCGEATQHQLLHTTLKPRKVNKIFITHLHGDHIYGLPGFLSSRSYLGGTEDITIYGPVGIKQFVETSLQISSTHLSYQITFVELEEAGLVFEDDAFKVDCVLLDHGMKCFGYRIKEKDMLGSLDVNKLKLLGIQPGPIFKQIKENETTILEDGRTIARKDVIGEPKKGKNIVIFGDTRSVPQYSNFVKNADLLIHEATFSHEKADLAAAYFHSTTVQAAQFAKDSQVKALIMSHISSRYQMEEEKQLLKEAQAIFPCTMIAHDFFTYQV